MNLKAYLIHSPYPDKSWRGIEKCLASDQHPNPILLFPSREQAQEYLQINKLDKYFLIQEVEIYIPQIKEPIH